MDKGSWAAILPLRGAGLEPWLGGVSGSPAQVYRDRVYHSTLGAPASGLPARVGEE